jgi:hypothetical protein
MWKVFQTGFMKGIAWLIGISFGLFTVGAIAFSFQNRSVTISPAPTPAPAPVQGAMCPQFKEQARRAFYAIQRLDPDDRNSNLKPHITW